MTTEYRLQYLRGYRLRVFLAVADRIIPADGEAPGGGTLATAGVADWALARTAPGLRRLLLLLLYGVEALGIFFGGKPFSFNSPAARDRQLRWMEGGRVRALRLGFFGLKSFVCMGYYTREEIWSVIGYEGPVRPDRPFPDAMIRALCRGEARVRP